MLFTSEQVMNGLIQYMENEIVSKMPTVGKIIVGTGIGLALKNQSDFLNNLRNNQVLKMIGAVNEEGLFDVDTIAECAKQSSEKYGNVVINIPYMGDITLTSKDIDLLKRYIR